MATRGSTAVPFCGRSVSHSWPASSPEDQGVALREFGGAVFLTRLSQNCPWQRGSEPTLAELAAADPPVAIGKASSHQIVSVRKGWFTYVPMLPTP